MEIKREEYLNKLRKLKNKPDIKVISGVRRCGKSALLSMFAKETAKEKNSNNIVIDFNDMVFTTLLDYKKLYEYIESKIDKKKQNYIFIDEVQDCIGFEKVINSFYGKDNIDIYLTGSNAFLLSSELSTLLTGRYMKIDLLPFSFKEYIKYYEDRNLSIEEYFNNYLIYGGMPGSYNYEDDKDKQLYIEGVYSTIVSKDIIQRFGIKNDALLNDLAKYLLDNVGNITSAKKISDFLTSNISKTNSMTIQLYLDYLSKVFLFNSVSRYDIKGKRYLSRLDKYYFIDQSFRWAVLGKRDIDFGHVLENIVYLELLRKNFRVYVGKIGDKEIDFIAENNEKKVYIQVCENIGTKEILDREVGNLLKINDGYPKMVITKLNVPDYQINGVEIVDIARWLLE